jgi:MSHA pilin protein MshA
MKFKSLGFTMIELIVVIVILGVLSAVALPKFIDLKGDAVNATVNGVAGAAASAMNINYAGCALTGNVATANKCATVNTCSAAQVGVLLQGGLPAGFAIAASGAAIGTTNGNTGECVVSKEGKSASFLGISAGN